MDGFRFQEEIIPDAPHNTIQEAVMHLIGSKELRALLLVAIIGLACSCGLIYGQGTNGSLTGQVTDPTGAAIVGANVTLTDTGTGDSQVEKTDSTGVYLFKLVPAGNYALGITAQGFAAYNQTGIVMNANLYATQNVHLTIAKVQGEVVNVTANAELIDTTTAELGMTINEQSVSDLPFPNRDPSAVALLAPGIVDGNHAGVAWQQAGFSFPNESVTSSNGGRIGSTFYMLDGVSNMDTYLGSNSPTPNSDATQEFRLISNNFSAVYGFSTGGVVSMATGAAPTSGTAACGNSCATEILTRGTGATTFRILTGATSSAAMSADRLSRTSSSSSSTTREPSLTAASERRLTVPPRPPADDERRLQRAYHVRSGQQFQLRIGL
jgi:hypothetical protein